MSEIPSPLPTEARSIKKDLFKIASKIKSGIKRLKPESVSSKLPEGVEELKVNGVQVLVSGKDGPKLLFLHNAGQVPEGMTEHILQLAPYGQVIAPNIFDLTRAAQRRGITKPSFADLANEISALNLINKGDETGLVTSSMGSAVGWEYTIQNPEDVKWIVAGSAIGWPLKRSLTEWVMAFRKEFLQPPNVPIPDELKKRDPGSGMMMKRFLRHPSSVLKTLKLTTDADQREQLQAISQPVNLIWGKDDNYVPVWAGQAMARSMVNSRLELTSKFNHLWVAVEPEKLTKPAIDRIQSTSTIPTTGK